MHIDLYMSQGILYKHENLEADSSSKLKYSKSTKPGISQKPITETVPYVAIQTEAWKTLLKQQL